MNELISGFTIKTVAERTGISVYTLRAWERRYGIPRPMRHSDNHYRLYDDQDIADVLWMKRQIESGLAPSQASLLFQHQRAPRAIQFSVTSAPLADKQALLFAALLNADEGAAQKILDESFALFPSDQVALAIIQPTMIEIGERWARNEITIWQEHLASNLVRRKLFSVIQSQATSTYSPMQLVAACAPSEDHEIGLLTLSLLAQRQGWHITYLGPRSPLADIAAAAQAAKANLILISITTVVGLAGMIPWLRSENRPSTPVVFGGRLPNLISTLPAHLPGECLQDNVAAIARSLALIQPRAHFWSPSKRALDAVNALYTHRLTIAAETISAMSASMPSKNRHGTLLDNLNVSTLYLVDSIASALAFDAPEIMDLDKSWLGQTMPPRAVPGELIARHIDIFTASLAKHLSPDHARQFKLLLGRLKNNHTV